MAPTTLLRAAVTRFSTMPSMSSPLSYLRLLLLNLNLPLPLFPSLTH